MYDRLFNQVCGMFNPLHFTVIVLFFGALWFLLHVLRNVKKDKMSVLLRVTAVVITVLEIVKIAVRIGRNEGPDSWVPLYYCSLFIFAVWFAVSPWKQLRRAGLAYICMGGVAASVFFVFYPSTALGLYPLFHPATLHSMIYHLTMCCTGLLVLKKGLYVPQKRDLLPYAIFILAACFLAAFVNAHLGTNCMFMEHPFGLPFLEGIRKASKPLYMGIVAFAQSVCMFCVCFEAYRHLAKRFAPDKACTERSVV